MALGVITLRQPPSLQSCLCPLTFRSRHMATAIFPPPGFFSPFQALGAWLMRPLQEPAAPSATQPLAVRAITLPPPRRVQRVVRVLRVVEGGEKAGAGRMVISGRMADVCAELDRLAAQEAAKAARGG